MSTETKNRRRGIVVALGALAVLEVGYASVGARDVEAFIGENVGDVAEALTDVPTQPPQPAGAPVAVFPQGLTGGMAYSACSWGGCNVVFNGMVGGVWTLVFNGMAGWTQGGATAYWATRSDGDFGQPVVGGFYHQELTAGSGGSVTLAASASFALPRGTACGFHNTRNSPAKAPGLGTCMGLDPAYGQCPAGWRPRNHFDMSSDYGQYVWCEYLDPKGLCPDGSPCAQGALQAGYAIAIASNTEPTGYSLYGNGLACPIGGYRSVFVDAGRPGGQGLGVCTH